MRVGAGKVAPGVTSMPEVAQPANRASGDHWIMQTPGSGHTGLPRPLHPKEPPHCSQRLRSAHLWFPAGVEGDSLPSRIVRVAVRSDYSLPPRYFWPDVVKGSGLPLWGLRAGIGRNSLPSSIFWAGVVEGNSMSLWGLRAGIESDNGLPHSNFPAGVESDDGLPPWVYRAGVKGDDPPYKGFPEGIVKGNGLMSRDLSAGVVVAGVVMSFI